MIQYIYRTDEKAGGVVRMNGVPEVQWTALRSEGRWYVVIHSDLSFSDRAEPSLKCLLNMIQNSLRYQKAA
jgi:hypothetical protein